MHAHTYSLSLNHIINILRGSSLYTSHIAVADTQDYLLEAMASLIELIGVPFVVVIVYNVVQYATALALRCYCCVE